jgi:hypothetical protein
VSPEAADLEAVEARIWSLLEPLELILAAIVASQGDPATP